MICTGLGCTEALKNNVADYESSKAQPRLIKKIDKIQCLV
jgi:hypothetical protein